VGTCEQCDTGQGHPDKGTGHRSDDYLQIHGHFFWNGRLGDVLSLRLTGPYIYAKVLLYIHAKIAAHAKTASIYLSVYLCEIRLRIFM